MGEWANINSSNNRFRYFCDINNCNLSICNLLDGRLHITTLHNKERHSITFSNQDMVFIVSQFIASLPIEDRKKLLDFYNRI